MNLLAPALLWWLLPVGGAIAALYMLRLKRRDVTVASTLLWQEVLQDTHANAPLQKLKRNLLLVLQLLLALAVVVALARPFLWASGLGGQSTALILDASASMRATDEPGGRFAVAVSKAREMIARKSPGDAVAVILSADKPVVLCPLTTDKARLEKALGDARPTDTTGDLREAILFAATLVSSRSKSQVTVLTDGAFGRVEPMALGGARLQFVTVGRRTNNSAITAFDVRDTLGGSAGQQAFVTVQNFGAAPRRIPLEIRVNNSLTDAHEVTLAPGESHSEVFDRLKTNDNGGLIQARLASQDDLPSDNTASIVLPPRHTLRLLLVTEGNAFFERALTSDSRVVLDETKPSAYKLEDSVHHDATIWDNTPPPPTLPVSGRYLFWGDQAIGASAVPVTALAGKNSEQPQILDWSRTHPLMRFVDLANVKLLRARSIAPAPWAQTLSEGSNGPLIVAGERSDGGRTIYVGFNVLESDMPLRVAFPVFLSNSVQWLTTRPGEMAETLHPGEPIEIFERTGKEPFTLVRPDGTSVPVTNSRYPNTTDVGIYKIVGRQSTRLVAVSLLSAAESNLAPVAHPLVAVTDSPDAATKTGKTGENIIPPRSAAVRRELWPYLAAFVLLGLGIEWWVYHRRV